MNMNNFQGLLAFAFLYFLNQCYGDPLCDNVCKCKESSPQPADFSMDCSRCRFNAVPFVDKWENNTTILNLSHNNISKLEVEMTHEMLSVLKLDHNQIKSVVPNAFGGLKKLRELDLSYNFIESMDGNAFYGLEGLLILNISHNKFKTLSSGELSIFSTLAELDVLSLSNNPIKHIEKYHFNRILLLKTLDLSNTDVYDLPSDLFSRLDHLQNLNLAQNHFLEVPTNGLRSAANLMDLNLSENPITKLTKKSFTKMHTLQHLQISFMMDLETVEEKTFSPLRALQSLEMKCNQKLTSIDSQAFLNLFNKSSKIILKNIDLQQNQLTTLFQLPCHDITINLQRNPWTCDCRMKWIKRCELHETYARDLRCNLPWPLRNKSLVSINEDDYKCEVSSAEEAMSIHENRVMRTTFLVIGASLMVSLALAIVVMVKWRSMRNWWRNRRKGPGAVYYIRAKSNNNQEI